MKDMKEMNTKQETGKMSTNYPLFNPYSTLTCPRNAHRSVFYIVAVAAMLLLGSWNSEVWGADPTYCTYGFTKNEGKTSINNGETIYRATINGTYYGLSKLTFQIKMTKSVSLLHNESADLNYDIYLYNRSTGSWSKRESKTLEGYGIGDESETITYTTDLTNISAFKVVSTTNFGSYKSWGSTKYTYRSVSVSNVAFVKVSSVSANPTSLIFGDVTYGQHSAAQTVTATYMINYEGNMTASCTGDFSATVVSPSCACVDAPQTKTINVTFTPTQAGPRNGTLTIKNPNGTKTTVSLTGTGVHANPTLKMNNSSVNVTTDQANPVTLNLANLKASGTTSGIGDFDHFEVRSADAGTGAKIEGVTINGNNFSSIVGGTYTVRAITKQNNQYNSTYKDFTVTVNRLTQTISWSTDESVFVEEDVISATSIGDVTLEKSGTGAEYVTIDGNTATVGEVETNSSVTLTATAAQTDVYAQTTGSKTITLTSLQKQHITFEQNLTKLKTTDGTKKVELVATSDSGRDSYITFAVDANTAGVTVTKEGGKWYLNYTAAAVKDIAVTASLAGVEGVSVAASDVSQMVKVTDPTAKCDINEGLATASGLANTTKTYDLTIPKQVVLKVRSSKSKIYTNTYEVKFYDKNNKEISTGSTQSWTGRTWDQTIDTRTFSNLNKDIVKMVFKSNASNGFDITEASYTRWSYANPSVNRLDFEALALSTVADQTFTFDYANYQVELSIEGSSNFVLKSADSFGDCETYGTQTIKVGYNVPAEATVEKAFLYIKDNTGTELAKITLNATVQGGLTQNITSHNIATSYKTTDLVNLTAETDRGLTNFSYSATPAGVAVFDGPQMTFKNNGIIAITVTEPGNATFAETSATVNNVVVSKVTPAIATNPDVAVIHYLDNFSNSQLSNGLATVTLRGEDNTPVAGTFTWTTINNTLVTDQPGTHNYSVTFTPDDLGMYNPVTFSMPVVISRALVPVLDINGTSVDVSRIVPEQNIDHRKTVLLSDLVAALPAADRHPMDKQSFTYAVKSVDTSNEAAFSGSEAVLTTAHIDNAAKTFYATEVGDYTLTVSSPATDWYEARDVDFHIVVRKLQPALFFSAEDTVYLVRTVRNAAVCICENETIVSPAVRYASADKSAIDEQEIYGENAYQLIGKLEKDDSAETRVSVAASFAGNRWFLPADNSKEYIALSKYMPRFFINGTEGSRFALKVSESAQASFEYCLPYNHPQTPMTYAILPANIITYNPETQQVTAIGEGTASITFTQVTDAYRYEASRAFEFVVGKNLTSLNLAEQVNNAALYVGDVLSGTLWTANTGEVPVTVTSSNPAVITYKDGEIRALAEGDATLTFSMTPSGTAALKWTSCSVSKQLHVSRRSNTLTANYMSLTKSYGGSETIVINASNTDYENNPVTLEPVTNGDLVAVKRITANSFLVTAKHTEGTVTLRATQDISNAYTAASLSGITFTVGKSNYHVPIDLNSTMYNDSYCCIKKEGTTSVSGSEITLGQSFGGGFNWDDKYVIFRFEGIPDKLTFDFRCYSIVLGGLGDVTNVRWYIQESADGNFSDKTWTSSRTDQDSYESVTIQLQPNTRYVKLCYGGNYSGQFKNIHISERSELVAAEPATTAAAPYVFDAKPLGSDDSEQQFTMDWYNIDVVSVTFSDPHFSVAPSSFADYEDYGQQPVTVIYHRSTDIGVHTATVTVTNGTQTRRIYVKGETTKKTATITWHPDIESCGFLMNPDEVYPAGSVDYVAEVSNGGSFTLSSDNESVISVSGNTLTARNTGSANITVSYAGSGDFYPASVTKQFTVTTATKQTINWPQNLMTLRLGDAPLALNATASSGEPLTYTLADNGIVSVASYVLRVDAAGDTYITATQAGGTFGGITYAPISMTKRVHVGDPAMQCTDYAILNQSCTFASLQKTAGKVFTIDGPAANRLYFSAYHDKASGTFWDNFEAVGAKNYNPLVVEEYRNYNNTWEWHEIFNQVVNKETAGNYSAVIDPTATKIRFSSNEEVTHHVSNISLRRRKSLTASETSVSGAVDCKALFTKTIRINYSGLDVLTASVDGGFSLDKATIGNGCGTYGTEEIIVSLTPSELKTYSGTIVITDGKTAETRLTIPVTLEAQPVSQTIIGFTPADSYLTTDDVRFTASVLSGNLVYYTSSDESVATVDAEGSLSIHKSGTLTVTAHCDAADVYAAAPDVARTFTISKVTPVAVVAPAASQLMVPATVGQAEFDLSAALMHDDKGNAVTGTFAWKNSSAEVTAGTFSYMAVFTPDNTGLYNSAELQVAVTAVLRPQLIRWSLEDNSSFYCFENITCDAVAEDAITGEVLGTSLHYTSSDPSVADVNSIGQIIIKQTGTVTITAMADAEGLYLAAGNVQRTVTFEKATPVISVVPSATPISVKEPLDKSYFYKYKVSVPGYDYDVSGRFEWADKEHREDKPGHCNFPAKFIPSNTQYFTEALCEAVPVRIVSSFWTFVGKESSKWDEPTNWSNAGIPRDLQPDITVLGDLHIADGMILNSVLIDSTGSVTVTDNANVTVAYETTFSESGKYGDLIVEHGGKLTLNTPLNVHNFVLSSRPSTPEGVGNSGQIVNIENLNTVDGDIYFEIEITEQADGSVAEDQWYGFAVPFPVSFAQGDASRLEEIDGKMQWNSNIVFDEDYGIGAYQSQRRATYGKGWQRVGGRVLYPGNFYMLGIASQSKRYRFRKVKDAPFYADCTMKVNLYDNHTVPADKRTTDSGDFHWNAIANPNLLYSKTTDKPVDVNYAVIMLNGAYSYKVVPLNSTELAVGTPFFVQTTVAGSVTVTPTAASSSVAARRNAPSQIDACAVTFAAASAPLRSDRIYISASNDAEDRYEIGRDLNKMAAEKPVPELWINAYGKHLCVNTVPLHGSEAVYPVTFSAPAAGEYVVNMESGPADAEVYLMYNGRPIWNLAYGPCTLDLQKGKAEGYSLMLHACAPRISTDVEETDAQQDTQVQKFVKDGMLYILRDGVLYDATGRKVE